MQIGDTLKMRDNEIFFDYIEILDALRRLYV